MGGQGSSLSTPHTMHNIVIPTGGLGQNDYLLVLSVPPRRLRVAYLRGLLADLSSQYDKDASSLLFAYKI